MGRYLPLLSAAVLSILGSVGTFAILVAVKRPGWASHEYLAITAWSAPVGLLTALLAQMLRRRLAGRPGLIRGAAALAAGAVIGVGWAFATFYLSGGWVMAFDAPVLYCWSSGAVLGCLTACFWPDMSRAQSQAAA
jgi:hypothetical protein